MIIELFIKTGCNRCTAIKKEMQVKGIAYIEFDVITPTGLAQLAWRELVKVAEEKGLPLTYPDDSLSLIKCNDEVCKL